MRQFVLLGELAAGVAHDIKNPLMSIRGCARLLEKNMIGHSYEMEFLRPIITEADRINEVIEQMLSYVYLTKEDSYDLVDLNAILDKCLNVIRFHKKTKQVILEKKLDPEIPFISGNNVELQQAFVNILINAMQAIEEEGRVVVETRYQKETDEIKITIADTGAGISPENMGRVFRPFFTTKKDGNGIGLSIVERVIKKHGGKIQLSSSPDVGTEFMLYLPCTKEGGRA